MKFILHVRIIHYLFLTFIIILHFAVINLRDVSTNKTIIIHMLCTSQNFPKGGGTISPGPSSGYVTADDMEKNNLSIH